jgi:hypothetical protein
LLQHGIDPCVDVRGHRLHLFNLLWRKDGADPFRKKRAFYIEVGFDLLCGQSGSFAPPPHAIPTKP